MTSEVSQGLILYISLLLLCCQRIENQHKKERKKMKAKKIWFEGHCCFTGSADFLCYPSALCKGPQLIQAISSTKNSKKPK
jgi:hypothetical protein